MFLDSIGRTAFTTPEAEAFFKNKIVSNTGPVGDAAMISMLRAMLGKRMPAGDVVTYNTGRLYGPREFQTAAAVASDISENVSNGSDGTGCLTVVSVGYPEDARKQFFSLVGEAMKTLGNWEEVQKYEYWFKKSFQTKCFIHRGNKSTMVFVERATSRKNHLLMAAVPVMFPWYFPENTVYRPLEIDLCKSCKEESPAKFLDLLQQAAGEYNFRDAFVRSALTGFESGYERRAMEHAAADIRRFNSQIDNYFREIENLRRRLLEKQIIVSGCKERMKSRDPAEETPLVRYFLSSEAAHLVSADESSVEFIATGYLDLFDEDEAEKVIENEYSALYESVSTSRQADYKLLLRGLFVEQQIRLRTCAAFRLYAESEACGLEDYEFDGRLPNAETYFPNPHIQGYHCLGDNRGPAERAILDGNYPAAVDQLIAACHNLNWRDGTVVEYFSGQLLDEENPVIELPTGELVSPAEAIQWLKDDR